MYAGMVVTHILFALERAISKMFQIRGLRNAKRYKQDLVPIIGHCFERSSHV